MDSKKRAQSESDSSAEQTGTTGTTSAYGSDESPDANDVVIDANTAESAGMVPKHGKLILKAKMDIPKIFEGDTYLMKLPPYITMETTPFDPEKYKAECETIVDEEGRQRMMLRDAHCIRWREKYDDNGEFKGIQSNAQWIDWSDGTSSLRINGEYFDIKKEELPYDMYFGENKGNRIDVYNKYKGKLSIVPPSLESRAHQNIRTHIVERSLKNDGVKQCHPSEDPLRGFENKVKAEMRKLRKSPSGARKIPKKKNLKPRTVSTTTEDTESEDAPSSSKPPVATKEAKPNASEDSDSDFGPNSGIRKRKTGVNFVDDSDD